MKKLLVLIALLCLATTAAAQPTPTAVGTRIKALNDQSKTWGTFWAWFIENFPNASSPEFYWYAYQATGDAQYLPALQNWKPIPVEWMSIHDDHALPIDAAMAKSYVSEGSWNNEWVPTLKLLADMSVESLLSDSDDGVLNPLKIFKRTDMLLGTSYMDSQHAKDCEARVNDFLKQAQGGVWIVSSDYDIHDVFFLCELAHLFGTNHWPDLPQFLKDHTRYLVWSTTSDFSAIEQHGDIGAPVHDPHWHYRQNLFCMLTTLLPESEERALAMKMVRSRLSVEDEQLPRSAYNFRFNLANLLCYFDPSTLGTDPMQDSDWPTGLFSHDARGIVIYRTADDFLTFDARVPTNIDHDQQGGMGSWEWYKRQADGSWKWMTIVPGGYTADWSFYNCANVGGMGNIWGWSRTYLGAKEIEGGFEASCEMRGPYLRPGTFGPTYQYLDRWRVTLTYNGQYVQAKHEWITREGQPVIDPAQPRFQLLLWNPDPSCTYKTAGAESTVGPEDTETWFKQIEQRVTFKSEALSGVLTLNFGPGDVPQPDVSTVSFQPEPIPPTPPTPPVTPPGPVVGTPPASDAPKLDASLFTGPAFSIAAWFKADAGAGGTILGQTAAPLAANPSGWVPALHLAADGTLRSSVFWHGDTGKRLASAAGLNDGKWHQAIVTYDGTTETLYIDGQSVGQQTVPQRKYADAYLYFVGTGYTAGWVGGNGGWDAFAGQLDKVAGFAKALTAADVSASFAAGREPPVTPPVLPFRVEYRQFSDRIERVEVIPVKP